MASASNIRAGGAFVEIFAKDGAFQQAMTRVQNKLRATGKNMQQFGTGMAVGAGAVGAPLAMALRQFAGFDTAVRATAAAAGRGEKDLAGMRDAAEALGLQMGMSAADVASLGIEIARAFGDKLSPEQINKVTEAVLKMAKASGTDGALAASIMTSTMAQFGLGADQATRVADVLTVTSNATLNSVESLGEALSYAGVNAAEMGMSLEETAAILGTLGNVGIQGSMAGTTLRRLSTVTAAEATKLQEIFGVAFQDAAGNARPLVDVLGEVYQATADLPSAERAKKFSDAFGLLGITGARSIGKMSADTRKLADNLRNAAGASDKQSRFMMAGIGGAGAKLLVALQSIGNAFGEAIAGPATALANGFAGVALAIRQLVKAFPVLSQIAAASVAGLFALGVAGIAGGFALQVMASGIGVLAKLIAALATPMGMTTAVIVGGVAAILVAAYQLSPAFRQEADAIMAALSRLDFKAAWEVMNLNLAIALTQMAQMFGNAWATVKNTVAATASFIGDKLTEGLDRFLGVFGADILTIQAGLERLGLYFKAAFDWNFWRNGLDGAVQEMEARIERARANASTADQRAANRAKVRQEQADGRQAENDARNQGYESTIGTLRDDLRRARERALGIDQPAEEAAKPQPAQAPRPVVVSAPAAEPAPEAAGGGGGNTLGTFADSIGGRLGAGPTLTAAQRTASATERTADGVEQLLRANNGVGNEQGVGNEHGVGNPMGVGNESGVLGGGSPTPAPAAVAAPRTAVPAADPAPAAVAAPMGPLDSLPAMTAEQMAASFSDAGWTNVKKGTEAWMAKHRGEPAAVAAPRTAVPAADPAAITRAGASAMPPASSASQGLDKELLSVAERQAGLAQQMVDQLRQLLDVAKRGGLAFS